jgi:hypothetical protein
MLHQLIIPCGLSIYRYISGFAALNLPAPEGTSGDWHFDNNFYTSDRDSGEAISFIAGEGPDALVNTNHIYAEYGIYECRGVLEYYKFDFDGTPHAANHFRAALDMLYYFIMRNRTPRDIYGAAQDFFDTAEQEKELFSMAEKMKDFLSPAQQNILDEWFWFERHGNQKYAG